MFLGTLILACMTPWQVSCSSGPSASSRLKELFGQNASYYAPTLPRSLLDKARGITSDDGRLRRFARKLVEGGPVTYVVLGGSKSTTKGATAPDLAWPSLVHKWLELHLTACGRKLMKEGGVRHDQSLPSYKDHMGHVCPAQEEGARSIRFVNLAVPGVDPSFLERCRFSHIPPEVDLVILELSANDDKGFNGTAASIYDVPTKRSIERLLRKVLLMPSQPALLMLDLVSITHILDVLMQEVKGQGNFFYPYHDDFHTLLAQWYGGIQTLHMRNAFHHVFRQLGLNSSALNPQFLNFSSMMMSRGCLHCHPAHALEIERLATATWHTDDMSHEGGFGHRVIADVLISYLQSYVKQELLEKVMEEALDEGATAAAAVTGGTGAIFSASPTTSSRSRRSFRDEATILAVRVGLPLASPSAVGAGGGAVAAESSSLPAGGGGVAPPSLPLPPALASALINEVRGGLPPPFVHGNYEHPGAAVCHFGRSMRSHVVQAKGFELVDEGKNGQHKWGYVGLKTGDSLVLTADTTLQVQAGDAISGTPSPSLTPDTLPNGTSPSAEIHLSYLVSYDEVMGAASVSCVSGCTCRPVNVMGLVTSKISVSTTITLNVTASLACQVKIEILPPGTDVPIQDMERMDSVARVAKGSKFKVVGLVVSEAASSVGSRLAALAEELQGGGS